MNTLSCQVQVISNEHDAGTVHFLKFGSNVAMLYGVPFVSKFMYFPWYHTMNSIIIPSILYNYIMPSIIYNPFYNIESVLYYTIHSIIYNPFYSIECLI